MRNPSCGRCITKFKEPLEGLRLWISVDIPVFCLILIVVGLLIPRGEFATNVLTAGAIGTFLFGLATLLSGGIVGYVAGNIIGQTFYFFKDQNGSYHYHSIRPTKADAKSMGIELNGAALQLKAGGWFRRNRIITDFMESACEWRISRGSFGIDIFNLTDKDGNKIAIGFSLEALLDLVNQCPLGFEAMYKYYSRTQELCDYFGKGVMSILEQIKDDPARLGRSPHGKAMQTRIEALLNGLPTPDIREDLIRRWTEQLKEDQQKAASPAPAAA